jgi:hypothetical protein
MKSLNVEKILKKLTIDKEHKPKLEEINKYIIDHRV